MKGPPSSEPAPAPGAIEARSDSSPDAWTLNPDAASAPDLEGGAAESLGETLRRDTVRTAGAWVLGVSLAITGPGWLTRPWLLAWGSALALVWAWSRDRSGRSGWATLAAVPVAALWAAVTLGQAPRDDVRAWLAPEPRLLGITGVIEGPTRSGAPPRGALSEHHTWTLPSTLFTLRAEIVHSDAGDQTASGLVLVAVREPDHRPAPGMRVQVTGWFARIQGPSNPGEFDYRAYLAWLGVHSRLTVPHRVNLRLLDEVAGPLAAIDRAREAAARACSDSLRLGAGDPSNERHAARIALLETFLLGRSDGDDHGLNDAFRELGLQHVLAISGAHLTLLMAITWWLAGGVTGRPGFTSWIVLAVLVVYLLVIPTRVPVARAGLMAGIFALGSVSGRRFAVIDALALACIGALLWRPGDLSDPGFQLSFAVVAAMLLFTRPLGQRLWRDPLVLAPGDRGSAWARGVADFLAANLVASLAAAPILAYHFAVVNPLALLLSVLVLPSATALLGLGYLKIAVGLVLPSLGLVLAGPVAWLTDTAIALVEHARHWPLATWPLPQAPSAAWALATLGLLAAAGAHATLRRPTIALASIAALTLWAALAPQPPADPFRAPPEPPAPPLTVYSLSVADGSCHLIRVARPRPAPDLHIVYDCGSQQHPDVGLRTAGPALRALAVQRIDLLIISHADLDHFVGVLDLLDQTPCDAVVAPPHVLTEAQQSPNSAISDLLAGLRRRGISIEPRTAGWSLPLSERVQLTALWPPTDYQPKANNDASLVLAFDIQGPAPRRLLLSGDLARQGIRDALAILPHADIAEMPHHGSMVPESSLWLQAVRPGLLLQSSGEARLALDPWPELLATNPAQRRTTAHQGMIEVRFEASGEVRHRAFRDPAWRILDPASPPQHRLPDPPQPRAPTEAPVH